MEIKRLNSQKSSQGSAEWFTGSVRIEPLFEATDRRVFVARALRSSRVRAQPGTHIHARFRR